jgi:hypothetical protein
VVSSTLGLPWRAAPAIFSQSRGEGAVIKVRPASKGKIIPIVRPKL